tara:strand:+ start:536 stop:1510 length:975 start_codon:yes stop_codon:yes gene_type:complete
MAYLVLLVALAISGVAAWYSIAGLAAIFAAAKIPVIIMGSALEVGKLVTASWLYQNWQRAPFLLKSYLTVAVVVLMFITSMGIFGFLSKAHIDQTIDSGDNTILIEQLDLRIAREQKRVDDANVVVAQLDNAVQTLMDYDRIRGDDGAIAVRENQKNERDGLNNVIDNAYAIIGNLQSDRATLSKEQLSIEAEVGPIRYIAELAYGSDASVDNLDNAVRYVILIIISVFDPLAVLLLVAANMSLKDRKGKVTIRKVAAVVEDEWVETEVDVEEEVEEKVSADLEGVRRLLTKYRANAKGAREGTFIHTKIRKLENLEKELESKS